MIASLRHLLGWIVSSFRSREDLVLENSALRRQLLALHAQRPRTRLTALHKPVLGCVESVLVWVEETSRLGYSPNRRELASKLCFLKPGQGTVHIFCEHLSPDEPACHPKPKYLRQVERNPCDAGAEIWRTTGQNSRKLSTHWAKEKSSLSGPIP
jgi:hypothetical protein